MTDKNIAAEDNQPIHTGRPTAHSISPEKEAPVFSTTQVLTQNPLPGSASDGQPADDDLDEQTRAALKAIEDQRQQRKRRHIIAVVIAVVVVVAIIAAVMIKARLDAEAAEHVAPATAEATREDLVSEVTTSGKAQPISSVVVSPETDGIIQDVRVSEGQKVKKGDVLLTIKNDSLDRAVRDAKTEVDSAKQALSQAQTAYQQALSAWNGAASGEEQEELTDPDSLWGDVSSAQSQLESAQSTLADAQEQADKRTIRAPRDGSVVAVNAVNGAAIGSASGATTSTTSTDAGASLIQIADISQMTVTAQVNEIDISKLAVGQKASVTFSALPDVTLDGKVTHIATVATGDASEGVADGGVVSYAVTILIPKPDPKLKPGMTASVTITTQEVKNAIVVPSAAINDNGDGTGSVEVVTLADDGSLASSETRDVKIIAANDSESAVEGLKEGELVSLDGEGGGAGDSQDASGSETTAYEG